MVAESEREKYLRNMLEVVLRQYQDLEDEIRAIRVDLEKDLARVLEEKK